MFTGPLITFVIIVFVLVTLGVSLVFDGTKVEAPSSSLDNTGTITIAPVVASAPLTSARLNAMRWQDMGSIVSEVTANPAEMNRILDLLEKLDSPVILYLKALLMLAQEKPDIALGIFDNIDKSAIPADFLYAPHRLHRSLRPGVHDHYLEYLEQAVRDNKTSPLIKARVLAGEGRLSQALTSYMQTDPGTWARYDLALFSKISSYQGLSIDLTRMIAGAISSGRVKEYLVPKLKLIVRQPANESELTALEQHIKQEIRNGTPEGKIAQESVERLLRDRKIFLKREYTQLLSLYEDSDPLKLATETLLLLFLSAIDQNHRLHAEIWGQELKRRHAELEVRDWVNNLMASL